MPQFPVQISSLQHPERLWDSQGAQGGQQPPGQSRWERGGGGASNSESGWSQQRHWPRAEVLGYMSRSSAAGEPPSIASPQSYQSKPGNNNATDASRPSTSGTAQSGPQSTYLPIAPAGTSGPLSQPQNLPPLSTGPAIQTPSRGLGVHSILNPSSDAPPQTKRPAQTTGYGLGLSQNYLPPPIASPRSRKRSEPGSPLRGAQSQQFYPTGRRVLTPRSPGVRASSIGPNRNPAFPGPGPASQPFAGPEPRVYTAEPGSADIPSLPSLSSATRSTYPGLPGNEIPTYAGRFQAHSSGHPTGPSTGAPPRSDSPSTSQTSKSQPEQISPAYQHGTTASNQPQGGYPPARALLGGFSQDIGGRGSLESYQAGQSAYQMTLETDQGPMVVPVELDLQQASKVADEKRKRNAGASARFRARRKEKEKEASQTISNLQHELRLMQEERDFYRNERNYFREYAPRQGQLPQRPISPRMQSRPPPPIVQAREMSDEPEESGRARSDSAPATQRRRIGDYQLGFGAPTMPLPYSSGYAPQPPFPIPAKLQQLPGPYASPHSLPPGLPAPPTTHRPQQSYDNYRRESDERDSRSWNPGP